MKIAVIGYSGSGKSTLAAALGKEYGADVLHLDSVHFLPGWKERPDEEKRRVVEAFLDSHDSWVIDGTYTKLFYERRTEETVSEGISKPGTAGRRRNSCENSDIPGNT